MDSMNPVGQVAPILHERPLEVVAAHINAAHREAQAYAAKAVERALTAGDLLLSVKARLKHGEFGDWCKQYCPDISIRTIQDYMRVARELPPEKRSAAHLPASVREALRLVVSEHEPSPIPDYKLPWKRTDKITSVAATVRQWPDLRFAATAYMDTEGMSIDEIAQSLGLFPEEIKPFVNSVIPSLRFDNDASSNVNQIGDYANAYVSAIKANAYDTAHGWAELSGQTELSNELNAIYRMHKRNRDRMPFDVFKTLHIENLVGKYLANCTMGLEHFEPAGWIAEARAYMTVQCIFDYTLLNSEFGIMDVWENPDEYEGKIIPRIPIEQAQAHIAKSQSIINTLKIPIEQLGTATLEELNAEKKRLWDNFDAIFHADPAKVRVSKEAQP
jgi:hypothetical protein